MIDATKSALTCIDFVLRLRPLNLGASDIGASLTEDMGDTKRFTFVPCLIFNRALFMRALTCFSLLFAHSYNLEAASLAPPAVNPLPQNQAGWTTIDLVGLSKAAKADCVVQDPLVLRCAGPIRIEDLSKTFVRGQGMRLEFLDPAPGKGGIVLTNASDVALSDMEIGWLGGGAHDESIAGVQRIQTFGEVVACGNRPAGGMLSLEMPLNGMQPIGAVSIWDDKSGWPWYQSSPDIHEVYFQKNTVASFTAGKSDCLPQLAKLVGQHILLRHFIFANHAFQCLGCSNITVEKVRVTSAPGMGFVFGQGGSNLVLRNNVVEPKCSPRCDRAEPSVTQDASHFAGVQGNILLENNDFGWQGDDGVNVTALLIPARAESGAGSSARFLVVEGTNGGGCA